MIRSATGTLVGFAILRVVFGLFERWSPAAVATPRRSNRPLRTDLLYWMFTPNQLAAAAGSGHPRGLRERSSHVVPVQHGVEDHVELGVVLPAVDRVVREEDHAPFPAVAARHLDGKRAVRNLVRAPHQAAGHVGVAP